MLDCIFLFLDKNPWIRKSGSCFSILSLPEFNQDKSLTEFEAIIVSYCLSFFLISGSQSSFKRWCSEFKHGQ